ncbi:MAG TPA: M50 family metallopeptidase [Acidimicrobiia bacterium]
MIGGISAAIAILLFVTAHEAGHFLAAKATGMKATEFFFGFGPRLWSTKRGETEYGIKALPLGGYVRIVGMNPLEEVPPEDMGRTYREKKFWEKSVVVLAGVGTNFLIAFLLFVGVFMANGLNEPIPAVNSVIPDSPAASAGIAEGDTIVAVGDRQVSTWDEATGALAEVGPGPATIAVNRDDETLYIEVNLEESQTNPGSGYLGIAPKSENVPVGPIDAAGLAGQAVAGGVEDTFYSLYQMFRPSSLAQYFGVFSGDTDVPDEIRPVSPIGIVSIGNQTQSAAGFFGIMAYINVILATINFLPLFPLDGGHFAVALYEKITGREVNVRRLMPVAAAVIGTLFFLGFVAIILDIVNPISFG